MSTIQFSVAQRISSENWLAAVVLQRWWRGCADRRRIWRFGGAGTVRAAVRIQKVWRGHKGRLVALGRLKEHLDAHALVLCGFLRIIQAKNRRRDLRILLWNDAATKVQATWKQYMTRRMYLVLRHERRVRMALRIQQRVRMYQAACAARYLRENFPSWQARIHQRIAQYVSGEEPASINWIDSRTTADELVHTALLWLVGPSMLDLATKIAEVCVSRFPANLRGQCALFVCYVCNWTCRDRAGLIDEDMLGRSLSILQSIYEQCAVAQNEQKRRGLSVVKSQPSETACQSLFLHEEFAYFAAAVKFHRNGGRSLLAHGACQILRMHIQSAFSSAALSQFQTRIPQIFERYLQRTHGWAKVGAQLQVNVLDAFLQQHVVVVSVVWDFPDPKTTRRKPLQQRSSVQPNSNGNTMLYDVETQKLEAHHAEDPVAAIAIHGYSNPSCKVQLSVSQAGELMLITGRVVQHSDHTATCQPPDVITPLVLTAENVVKLFTAGRQWLLNLGREPSEIIAQKSRQHVVAEYVLHKLRLVLAAGNVAARPRIRATLPMLCYINLKRNLRREEDFACRILQKAFRGFVGRALWRRLQFPLKERTRQLSVIQKHRARLQLYRNLRTNSAKIIQQMVRGKFQRDFLVGGNKAIVIIQALFRGYRARVLFAQEQLRQRMGPAVEYVMKRGVAISGIPLQLTVYRSGLNYKFAGLSADGAAYSGVCYSDKVGELVRAFNERHPEGPAIRPWQQDRICKLIVQNLAIVADVPLLSQDLAKQSSSKVIVVQPGAYGRSILDYRGQTRVLSDQKAFYAKHDKRMRARARLNELKSASGRLVATPRSVATGATKHSVSNMKQHRKHLQDDEGGS